MSRKIPKSPNPKRGFNNKSKQLGVAVTIGAVALVAWITGHEFIVKGCAFGAAVYAINITMDSLSGGRKR